MNNKYDRLIDMYIIDKRDRQLDMIDMKGG
jgi:hypothetical protein